jgi:hypothetical protein
MTSLNLRRQPSATLRLRRLSTGNDYAHPRADLDSRRVVRSPLRDAGSAYRDRPTSFRHTLDRFPRKRSMHLRNRPPAPKSP